jgi:hypothetical protein
MMNIQGYAIYAVYIIINQGVGEKKEQHACSTTRNKPGLMIS